MFADILRYIFAHQNYNIFIWISLEYVPKGPVNNKPALMMIWCRPGDASLVPIGLNDYIFKCIS